MTIKSKPATATYRDNYDKIFGKAQLTDEQEIVGSVASGDAAQGSGFGLAQDGGRYRRPRRVCVGVRL
jgi:hypothetical protein